jgi:hypothetical protein
MTRVLVVGLPRSGTTWVGTMLGKTEEATLVLEPDNHLGSPFALRAKVGLLGGYYPALSGGDNAVDYARLWENAFGMHGVGYTRLEAHQRAAARRAFISSNRRNIRNAFRQPGSLTPRLRVARALAVPDRPMRQTRNVVAKSVYAARAIEWIAARVSAEVVVVYRSLLNLVSSWVEMGWTGPPGDDELAVSDPDLQELERLRQGVEPLGADWSPHMRIAWFLGLLTLELEDVVQRNPSWHVVRHDDLCADLGGFRTLAGRLGLAWTNATHSQLLAADRPGHAFEVNRVAAETADAWRSRLTPRQAAEVEGVFAEFGRAPDGSTLADRHGGWRSSEARHR